MQNSTATGTSKATSQTQKGGKRTRPTATHDLPPCEASRPLSGWRPGCARGPGPDAGSAEPSRSARRRAPRAPAPTPSARPAAARVTRRVGVPRCMSGGAGADVVADARFEVLGSPYSLLSVALSPSQQLYTRRGTLVAVAGNPETVSLSTPGPPRLKYLI